VHQDGLIHVSELANRFVKDPAEIDWSSLGVQVVVESTGRFTEAAASCQEHVRRHGPSAAAFHLLGLMRDALKELSDRAGMGWRAEELSEGRSIS